MNKTFEHTITKTYSIADIYGTDDPTIPEGYEAVEFRIPRKGETVLSNNIHWPYEWSDFNGYDVPRIILRKLPTPKDFYGTDNPEIPKGYRSLGLGKIKDGDYYLSGYNKWEEGMPPFTSTFLRATPGMIGKYRIILEKLPEPTIESIYGNPNPTIPEGWEKVDFRIPEMDEYFLDASSRRAEMRFIRDWESVVQPGKGSRIILRKKNREVSDSEILNKVLKTIFENVPSMYLQSLFGNKSGLTPEAMKKVIADKIRSEEGK